jgi:hypothetical protein
LALPYIDSLDVTGFTERDNRDKVFELAADPAPIHRAYWREVYLSGEPYPRVRRPFEQVRRVSRPLRTPATDLPAERYDLGSLYLFGIPSRMDWTQIRLATDRFIRSLKPQAPFAAIFSISGSFDKFAPREFDEDDVAMFLGSAARLDDVRAIGGGRDSELLATGWRR